jgi:hypothetical protein
MQQALLPKLAGTGRLCWRLSSALPVEHVRFVTLEKECYWQPLIEFVSKPDNNEWIVTGRLVQKFYSSDDIQQVRPLTDLMWLNDSGLALFPESLATIRITNQYGWMQLLRRQAELRIPLSQHAEFVSKVVATPGLHEMPLPDHFCPCRTDVVCQPRLRLASFSSLNYKLREQPYVFGTIDFLYEGHAVSINDPVLMAKTESGLVRRNLAAESQHQQSVLDFGALPFLANGEAGDISIQLPDNQANHILMKLLDANWEIEADGDKVKRPGMFRMGVSSGLDSFDLNGQLEFDGVSVSLPDVLQAAKDGKDFICLSDGSQGMLPEQWLKKYSQLVSLGEVDGDAVRFKPSQAMILDAMLEARRTRRLKADEVRRPSLVVVPKSLIFNWIKEAQRFAPLLKVVNHTGLLRHGNELSAADVIVTTYGTLRMDIVTIEKLHFDYIILNEAQAIKNSNSQSAKVCRLLKSDFRLAMTGTPVENHLGELWSLFEFLNPGMLGASSAFQRLTSSRDDEERAAALEMISKAL